MTKTLYSQGEAFPLIQNGNGIDASLDELGFIIDNVELARLNANEFEVDVPVLISDGTVSAPGLAFSDDVDTGIYRNSGVSVAVGGVEELSITSSGVEVTNGPLLLPDSGFTVANPTIQFGSVDNGIVHNVTNTDFVVGGSSRVTLTSTVTRLNQTANNQCIRMQNITETDTRVSVHGSGDAYFTIAADTDNNSGSQTPHLFLQQNGGISGMGIEVGGGGSKDTTIFSESDDMYFSTDRTFTANADFNYDYPTVSGGANRVKISSDGLEILTGGLIVPTTGGTATSLTHYEVYEPTINLVAADIASGGTVPITFERINNIVHVSINIFSFVKNGTTGTQIATTPAIPSSWRPDGRITQLVFYSLAVSPFDYVGRMTFSADTGNLTFHSDALELNSGNEFLLDTEYFITPLSFSYKV